MQAMSPADDAILLRELMAVAWDPLLIVHCSTRRIAEANASACRLYGLARQELIGSDLALRFSEARYVDEIFERHRDYVPLRFQRGHSERHFPVEMSIRYFETTQGEYAAVALRDITERIERERLDSQSERKYQSLFEASPYPILILNSHGMVVDGNHCALSYYGYDHEELIRLDWQAIDMRAGPLPFKVRPTMFGAREHRRKDGTTFIAEVMLSYFRLREQAMTLALVRDVTEHWRTFQQLQESEARWRFAIEGSGDALIDWPLKPDGSHIISPILSDMLGYAAEDDLGLDVKDWLDRVHPSDRIKLEAAIQAHIDGNEPLVQASCRMRERNGAYRWLALRAKVILTGGSERRLIGAIRDIHDSEMRKLQENADRAKMFRLERLATAGEMLSALAHEVNQPLTAISNYGALAIRQYAQGGNAESIQRALGTIRDQALRAGEIVRRIREFVRRSQPNFEPVSLNTLIGRVAKWCENDAAAAGAHIQLELDLDIPDIPLDILQIEQVLFNLFRNGIEAMQDESIDGPKRLIVRTTSTDAAVRVQVRDFGIGLTEGMQDEMFEPFVSSKAEGMGMGLAICRTIIESHGGSIWAEPIVGEAGTQFIFTLAQHKAGTRRQ